MGDTQNFRKLPVVIEARRWNGTEEGARAIQRWANTSQATASTVVLDVTDPEDPYLSVQTKEGTMLADPGDWIIRGVQGEFYPCKPDIFAATYEPAEPRPFRVEVYETKRVDAGPDGAITVTRYHWRAVHTSNREIMASGEGYNDKRDRDHAIDVLFPGVERVEVKS